MNNEDGEAWSYWQGSKDTIMGGGGLPVGAGGLEGERVGEGL